MPHRPSEHRSTRVSSRRLLPTSLLTLLTLFATALTLSVGTGTASADTVHAYLSQFNGSLTPQQLEFQSPGIAANQSTGAVYVPNAQHTYVFGASGEYQSELLQADGVTPYEFRYAADVAVDQATGAVYVLDGTLGVVDVFSVTGIYQSTIGAGVLPSESETTSVAVDDATGEVYVGARNDRRGGGVFVFSSSGGLLAEWTGADTPDLRFEVPPVVAVDQASHDVYVSESEDNNEGLFGYVGKFSAEGTYLSRLTQADGVTPYTFAYNKAEHMVVDSHGHAYVADVLRKTVDEFSASGALVGETSGAGTPGGAFGGPTGVAIGAMGDMYVADPVASPAVVDIFGPDVVLPDVKTESAVGVTEGSELLHGAVNTDETEVTSCRFEYGLEAGVYTTGSVPCEPAVPYTGDSTIHVTANLAGLEPRTTYHFRLTATNANGTNSGDDNVFFTSSRPLVEAESSSAVGSTRATVGAQLDAAGLPTTYRVEYGPTSAYGSSTPEASVGAGQSAAGALAQLNGLLPGVEYHFRFVATNALGSTAGSDTTFTTMLSTSLSTATLPDGRAYELVSPVKNANGDVYVPKDVPGEGGEGEGYNLGNEYDFTELPYQAAADGDEVAYVAEAPASGGNGNVRAGGGNEFLATRSAGGWSASDIEPADHISGYQAFSPDLTIAILGTTEQGLAPGAPADDPDLYARATSDGSYQALSTIKPPYCPSGFDAVNVPNHSLYKGDEPAFAGGNVGTNEVPEFSRLLFEANAALTAVAEANPPSCEQNDLYESIDGRLSLVNVLPRGTATAGATFGAVAPDFSHVISADGSRIFWTDLEEGADMGHIFVREDGETTVPVSPGAATYWTAGSDGLYAFYTEGEELWRFDVQSQAREAIAGTGANVQGVIGSSEDGSYVYFVADGVLASNENVNREVAREGEPNLYLWHEGVTSFLALSPSSSDWQPNMAARTAEVTPDGRHLVFMSSARLTGYDSEFSGGGASEEVFSYDAETGRIACASCDPSGAPPQTLATEGTTIKEEPFLPVSNSNTYTPRWMSHDGSRVFFETPQPLVTSDINGIADVYEWERDGSGSCGQSAGCVYLISGGTSSKTQSDFIDADTTGENVFFTTRDRLVAQDTNDDVDLYDARVNGGFAQPTPPLCTGTGCQGVPSATPVFATPTSVTFTGAGNFPPPTSSVKAKLKPLTRAQKLARALKACHAKADRRRRAVCEAQAEKRYALKSKTKKKAKRAGTNRRASR
jgi:hypothetical protein